MGHLDEFLARENIMLFKKQLVECSSEGQREMLNKLLAAEVEKLKVLEDAHVEAARAPGSAAQYQHGVPMNPVGQKQA